MTREEAISYGKRAIDLGLNDETQAFCELAIKALEQQPCEDAISRAAAVKVASGYCHPANIAKELAKLPPVTPQPKTGHWVKEFNDLEGEVKFDEAIKRYFDNAEYERTHGNLQGCLEFRQLAKLLKELKAYRKICHKEHVDDCLRAESGDFEKDFKEILELADKALEQEPTQYENYLKKSEVVISQLRADRDRLLKALNEIRVEIEKLQTYKMFVGEKTVYVELSDVLSIIDKYKGKSGE